MALPCQPQDPRISTL
ncbi:hypothetical protein PDE_02201 [Penicillium oxalicum 114-2]|uniref:Uncharacterized protein n=1 Tax=Penicillium oxalicum (strain 114-2 / CGMCC 5302) TaxID=933388 RepID=S8AMY5_PENO1|nr:hypothetical protein PDE_02201 [Penicillium oxalicum 114-2]